ncbi:MAG: phosphotransferase family protein [Anaerolineae bacterium]
MMQAEGELALFQSPADPHETRRSEWLAVSAFDPMVEYLEAEHWLGEAPGIWEVARLSAAAYVYRESGTGWALVAKYYTAKAGSDAERHAQREWDNTNLVRSLGLAEKGLRALRPVALERGALLLEYIEGLTLEDTISVRRSQPGLLRDRLALAARLLGILHVSAQHGDVPPSFDSGADYACKVVDNLSHHGVLQQEPLVRDALYALVGRWADRPEMAEFRPVLIHGDPTTTNFVFPSPDGVVAIDWERLKVADPAADLGRLMAEVSHSVVRHGGNAVEAEALVAHAVQSYQLSVPREWDRPAIRERARFYRASSTLRIARNGWLSRLERTALVAQALALLI